MAEQLSQEERERIAVFVVEKTLERMSEDEFFDDIADALSSHNDEEISRIYDIIANRAKVSLSD